MGRLVSQWANGYLEREGLARLTISILVITTAGCLAYTWGYAEGVHNTRTVLAASSKAATPLVLQQHSVVLQPPLPAADGSSGNGTVITAKKVHRRRPQKPATDMPVLPQGDAPASSASKQQQQQQQTQEPAASQGSTDAAAGGH